MNDRGFWEKGARRRRLPERMVTALVWIVAVCAVCAALLVSCQPGLERGPAVLEAILYSGPPLVRVALARSSEAGELTVACDGAYQVTEEASGQLRDSGSKLPLSTLAASGRGFRIGQGTFASEAIRLRASEDRPLRFRGNAYAGDLLCFRVGDGITVVNELDVESYLTGVLAAEMPLYFDDDALKAQVVASRTYALYEAKTANSPLYDLGATEAAQVYRGLSVSNSRVQRLVEATRGVILTVEGRTFPAYFHSTCGGCTTDVKDVWPSRLRLDVLRGVSCNHCRASPAYRWSVTIPAQQVAEALAGRELFSGPVTDVRVTGRADSGFATEVAVSGPQGTRRLGAYAFRLALGGRRVKSANFTITRTSAGFLFHGRGFGHGVGLCQWGAQGLAREGRNYREILTYYYPGAQLMRIYP